MSGLVLTGDCRAVMATLADASVDAVVTDPPYELSSDGKASAARVAAEVMLPKKVNPESETGGKCHLDFFARKIASLCGVGVVPTPPATVPVCSVALNDQPAVRNHDVEHGGELSGGGVAEAKRSVDAESKTPEHIGSFALKCTNREALVDALNSAGAGFLSGALGIGFRIGAACFPGFLRSGATIILSDNIVGLFDDASAALVGTGTRAEHQAVARLALRGGTVEDLSAHGALVLAAVVLRAGAQLVRTSSGAGGLPSVPEPGFVRYIVSTAHGTLSFDLATHTTTIASLGFMGKAWDGSKIAYDVSMWCEVFRVLKPGGHLLAFGGTRTSHRLVCAIEDAGFEIRDQLAWIFGSGFPKSLDVSKAIDRAARAEREVIGTVEGGGRMAGDNYQSGDYGAGWHGVKVTSPATDLARQWDGWGTALKPAHETICLARKPLIGTVAANVIEHGTGAINVDGCRVGTDAGWSYPNGRGGSGWHGRESLARNLDESMASSAGRWPPNVLLDDEAAALLDAATGDRPPMTGGGVHRDGSGAGMFGAIDSTAMHNDHGGASRYFPRFNYCAKASTAEREAGLDGFDVVAPIEVTGRKPDSAGQNNPRAGMTGSRGRRNTHPTIKPVDLMRWLVRLVTPPGGLVLDPFCGSGTTGMACALEDFRFVGAELDEHHAEIARARIAYAEERRGRPLIAEKAERVSAGQLPLFTGKGTS